MNGLLNLARLFIGLCLLLVHKPGFSHDLGVTKATLLEQPGQSYQLIVAAPPGIDLAVLKARSGTHLDAAKRYTIFKKFFV
jgi:hypothetical protein